MLTSVLVLSVGLSLAGFASAAPTLQARQATTDFGTCDSPEIVFKDGLDGRKETAFIAANQKSFNHGSALKIGVISSFICGQLESACKAPAATVATCKTAEAAGNAQTGGGSADAFNAAFGIPTTFAIAPEAAVSADGAVAGAANAAVTASASHAAAVAGAASGSCSLVAVTEASAATVTASAADNAAATNTCPTPVTVTVTAGAGASTAVAAASTAEASTAVSTAVAAAAPSVAAPGAGANNGAAAAGAGGINIGSCTNFAMDFAAGFDGRGAAKSFQPSDTASFAHTSALNPAIISEFMCDTFVNACGKSKSTQTACRGVKTKIDGQLAAGTLQKDQSYADAWLSGLESAFGLRSTGRGIGV